MTWNRKSKNRFRQIGNRYGSVSVSARTKDNENERMAYIESLSEEEKKEEGNKGTENK